MTSTSRRNKRIKYFSRNQHRQKQQQSKQNQNLDNALADAVNNMYISQTNFVPREWYEKLWRDFKNLDRDYGNLNISTLIRPATLKIFLIRNPCTNRTTP
ncbi:unnamed protein product [Rhizophagus irregularis]|nr:unnamed protein product [Rhizophagus irregularis]